MATTPVMAAGMTEEQQAIFYAQIGALEKDEVAGVLLALFLGSFGAHHFYLRRTGLGVAYLLFCWTAIPGLLGVIECFLMPARVKRYNYAQAAALAATLRGTPVSFPGQPLSLPAQPPAFAAQPVRQCASCGAMVADGVRFCARCGAEVP